MNTKVEQPEQASSAADVVKYVVAGLLVVASLWAYTYALQSWPAPLRGLLVAAAVAAAGFVFSLTAKGRGVREFFSESMFELRKVVWPTRQEAMRTTWVILVVVTIVSLLLAGFDFIIAELVKLVLG
ncbi:preprotein translocase subunit SecE [Arenimonas composti]|uniref:preprotein translocase subunit SecE n=1 Tax=Arenimonas composti TaxID=370776 RepID=UPI0004157F07|nr:preprotein translocase subunit SecE [Arenimonas composti]